MSEPYYDFRPDLVHSYICSECAKARKGEWKLGVTTWHQNTCKYCGEETGVTHIRHWWWPRLPHKSVERLIETVGDAPRRNEENA